MTAIEIFRLIATEFKTVPDESLGKWLELTAPYISKRRFGRLYDQALALLTAHRMKMAGGDSSYGTVGDTLRVGSFSEGETSIGFTTNQATNLLADGELALTPYGLEYLSLRRMVIIPIRSAGEAK